MSNTSQQSNDSTVKYTTLLIGLGFMTTGIAWSMYNTYVPIMLEKTYFYRESTYFALPALMIIGMIMTLDNILAWVIQPWIGAKSDNTWSDRWGRRMPYLLLCIPISAIAFIGIPLVWWLVPGGEFPSEIIPLFLFMIVVNIFNVFMAAYRSPVVALMPDLIAPQDRTKANGAINLMGGLGSVLAFLGGKVVVGFGRSLGESQGLGDEIGYLFGFSAAAIIMVLALILLKLTIKEPRNPFGKDQTQKVALSDAFNEVFQSPDRSGVAILTAIFFWFTGYQAVEAFFSLYGVYTLGIPNVEDAAFYLNAFALPFIIFAIPSGILASKIGRRKTIQIGLIGLLFAFLPLALLPMGTIAQTDFNQAILILVICLILGGTFWAFVNINSIVIVWEIGGDKRGAYTGLYYFFSAAASVTGPPLVGGLLYFFSTLYQLEPTATLFTISWIFFALAFLATFFIKSGELGQGLQNK